MNLSTRGTVYPFHSCNFMDTIWYDNIYTVNLVINRRFFKAFLLKFYEIISDTALKYCIDSIEVTSL